MQTYTYKGYLVTLERNEVNGSIKATAIPDSGETLRNVFYGYTLKQIKEEVRDMINGY